MTKSLQGAGTTNRRGVENDDSSDRLESYHTTPNQRTTSGSSALVHCIAHEAKYLKGVSITRDDVSKFVAFLERYDANGEYVQEFHRHCSY